MLIGNGKAFVEKHDLGETFNDRYINIVEKSSGEKPREKPNLIKIGKNSVICKIKENFNLTV